MEAKYGKQYNSSGSSPFKMRAPKKVRPNSGDELIASGMSFYRGAKETNADSATLKPTKSSTELIELDTVLNDEEKDWKDIVEGCADQIKENIKNAIISDLEELMDSSGWPPEEMKITKDSTLTLMKLIMFLKPEIPPVLGCDHGGNVIMYWGGKDEHLRFTCFSNELAIYYVSYRSDRKLKKFNGYKHVSKIKNELKEYKEILIKKFLN